MGRAGPSHQFPLVGEPVALDLVNTRVHRAGTPVDLLEDREALGQWLSVQAGRLPPLAAPSRADLHAVRLLRDAAEALITATMTGQTPDRHALDVVNVALAAPMRGVALEWTPRGPTMRVAPAGSERGRLLRALAVGLVDLITGPDAGRLRVCAHADCILRFVARNPRRIWCSAQVCGNRARVARHYSRSRAAELS